MYPVVGSGVGGMYPVGMGDYEYGCEAALNSLTVTVRTVVK